MAAAAFASCTRESVSIDGIDSYGPNTIAFTIKDEPGTRAGDVLCSTSINLGQDANGQAIILQDNVTRLGLADYLPTTKGTPATTDNVADLFGQFQADFFAGPGFRNHVVRAAMFEYDEKHGKWIHTFERNPFDSYQEFYAFLTMPSYDPDKLIMGHSVFQAKDYAPSANILDQPDLLIAGMTLTRES